MRRGNAVPNTGLGGKTLKTWIMNHWLSSIVSTVIHHCSDLIQDNSQVCTTKRNVTPTLCVGCESEKMFCTWTGIVLFYLLKHLCSSSALESFPAVVVLQPLHWSEVACFAVPRGFSALQLKFCGLWVYFRLRCMAQLSLEEPGEGCIENLSAFWNYVCFQSQFICEDKHVRTNWGEILFWPLSPMEPLPLVCPCRRRQLSGRSNFGDVRRGFNMKLSTDHIFKKMLGLIR